MPALLGIGGGGLTFFRYSFWLGPDVSLDVPGFLSALLSLCLVTVVAGVGIGWLVSQIQSFGLGRPVLTGSVIIGMGSPLLSSVLFTLFYVSKEWTNARVFDWLWLVGFFWMWLVFMITSGPAAALAGGVGTALLNRWKRRGFSTKTLLLRTLFLGLLLGICVVPLSLPARGFKGEPIVESGEVFNPLSFDHWVKFGLLPAYSWSMFTGIMISMLLLTVYSIRRSKD